MSQDYSPSFDEMKELLVGPFGGLNEHSEVINNLDVLFYAIGHHASIDMFDYAMEIVIRCVFKAYDMVDKGEIFPNNSIFYVIKRTVMKIIWSITPVDNRQPFDIAFQNLSYRTWLANLESSDRVP